MKQKTSDSILCICNHHDIHNAELYGAYAQSIRGGINADHNENKQSSEQIKNSYLEQFE